VRYGESVWIALVTALLIAASVEALISQERIVTLLARARAGGAAGSAGAWPRACSPSRA
jgi:hypothetical protein